MDTWNVLSKTDLSEMNNDFGMEFTNMANKAPGDQRLKIVKQYLLSSMT